MELTGAEALVAQLELEGVTTLFGIPGVQLDWVTDALRRARDRIRFYVPRHEQAVSYMADGYARSTGKVGVCMVVPGPGLLNAMAGLATAYACNSPVVCIAGQIHSSGVGKGAGLLHEIKGQSEVMSSVTKWSGRARWMQEIPQLVRSAFQQAHLQQAQPVGLEVPHDLLQARGQIELLVPPQDEKNAGRLQPNPAEITAAAALLDSSIFPVIYVGGGVLASGASEPLARLASTLDAPVVMGENGRGALSDKHPLALNAVGGRAVFAHADIAVIVGSRFIDTTQGAPLLPMGGKTRYIFLNTNPASWSAPRRPAATVLSDAKLGLDALADSVRKRPSRIAARLDQVRAWVAEQTASMQPQMSWISALRQAIPNDGILVNDLTQVGYLARSHYPVYAPGTFITPGYQGTLGFGFPTALGAAVGNPSKLIVSLIGDGGFGWNLQELATAARYQLNVAVVVFNDGRFGNVRTLQLAQFGEAFGDELYNPEFSKLAESFRVQYERAESPEQLSSVLKRRSEGMGPILIEAPVSPMPSPWHLMRLSTPPASYIAPPNPFGDPASS